MYTLFVPDMARSAFPCFDQPDLEAVFVTTLKVPHGWKTMTSDNVCQLPTYLYSFVAGNFQEKTAVRDGRSMRILYRETDPEKVAQLDQVFEEAPVAQLDGGLHGHRLPVQELRHGHPARLPVRRHGAPGSHPDERPPHLP